MAEGHTSARIAAQLHVSRSVVEKHINSMSDKPRLPQSPDYSRRVLAILRYLGT